MEKYRLETRATPKTQRFGGASRFSKVALPKFIARPHAKDGDGLGHMAAKLYSG